MKIETRYILMNTWNGIFNRNICNYFPLIYKRILGEHYNSLTKLLLSFIIITSCILVNSCSDNPGESTMGQKYVDSQTDMNLIDTFSVSLSTVVMDTIVTSNEKTLLVGSYNDDVFGKITSRGYFQIGIPNSDYFSIVDDNDNFDSLNLVIKYNNYYFGDTTKSQRLYVYQLAENIELNDNDEITSETTFKYNPTPIGSIVYTPRPHNTVDTLSIRISNSIGIDLLNKLKDKSELLKYEERFQNYFHGLMLASDDASEGVIIGFDGSQENTKLILYTSRDNASTEDLDYTFSLYDETKQFNNITHDFSSTQLSKLVEQQTKLPDTQTGGLSYVQGAIGLGIRVDFPSISEMLLRSRGTIVKAELFLAPMSGSYDKIPLASDLDAYETDGVNRNLSSVFESAATLTLDKLYHEGTTYKFDITSYLNNQINSSYFDPKKGLIISLPESSLKTSFSRAIIDSKNRNTKLKIYYLSY
jgi:hypothetical protein